jgi:hypothetical protein
VPLVSPEKNAYAIWQKKGFDITSVNGSVVVTPPQVPVSAWSRDEPTVNATSSATSSVKRIDNLRLFIMGSLLLLTDQIQTGNRTEVEKIETQLIMKA